jgi:hypothetical protein
MPSSAEKSSLESALSEMREIINAQIGVLSSPDIYSKATQLRAVQRTLSELNRKGVTAPEELQRLEAELLSDVVTVEDARATVRYVRLQLREMLTLVSKASSNDRKNKKRRTVDGSPRTSPEQLQSLVIECLKDHGGTGSPVEIFGWIQDRFAGRFLPGDLAKGRKGVAWRATVRGLRGRMIRAGLLRRDSRRGVWQLK